MAETIRIECPKCKKALEIPQELDEFSCLYCGERLRLADLLRPAAVTEDAREAEEYPYTKYMEAVVVFQSEDEHTRFLQYMKAHIGRYEELYTQQDDSELPPIADRKGSNMEIFRKEYRDALVIQKMLAKFREQGGGFY